MKKVITNYVNGVHLDDVTLKLKETHINSPSWALYVPKRRKFLNWDTTVTYNAIPDEKHKVDALIKFSYRDWKTLLCHVYNLEAAKHVKKLFKESSHEDRKLKVIIVAYRSTIVNFKIES